jgi:hypothetical protein
MKNLVFLLIVMSLFGCGQSDNSTSNNDTIRNEIKSTIDNYYNDIRKGGLLAELKYFDSSKQFFWAPPGYLNYIGYDAVVAAIRKSADSLKSVNNHYDSLLVVPLTNEYAQFAMRTISTSVGSEGDTVRTAFIETGVMVKRKDGWKFLSGHTTVLE